MRRATPQQSGVSRRGDTSMTARTRRPTVITLSGLRLTLPAEWTVKEKNKSQARISGQGDIVFTLGVDKLDSYEQFGSGKFDVTKTPFGSVFGEISTGTTLREGIVLNNGQCFEILANYGEHEVTSGEAKQIWDTVTGLKPPSNLPKPHVIQANSTGDSSPS